jgi:hypothetical protein
VAYWTDANNIGGDSALTWDANSEILEVHSTGEVAVYASTTVADVAILAERKTNETTQLRAAASIQATSLGDMADGFGPMLAFAAKDNAGVANSLAFAGAFRDGADNIGKIAWGVYTPGAAYRGVFSTSGCLFGLGLSATDAPASPVHIWRKSSPVTLSSQTALTIEATSTGTPGAKFGVKTDYLLESSTTNGQAAATDEVLWSDATHATRTALRRQSTVGNAATAGYAGQWSHNAVGTSAVTVIPDGTGDVTASLTMIYNVKDNTSGGTSGGLITLLPDASSVNLYNDGTYSLAISCAVNGSVTVTATGAHTFTVGLTGGWI